MARVALVAACLALAHQVIAQSCSTANSQQTCVYTYNDGQEHTITVPGGSSASVVVTGPEIAPYRADADGAQAATAAPIMVLSSTAKAVRRCSDVCQRSDE